jgi:hypothetical protein
MTPRFYNFKIKELKIYINQDSERHEVFGVKEFKKQQ